MQTNNNNTKKSYTAMDEINVKGSFVRTESSFRDSIKADESSKYPVESGRYHLYVSLACPWASRTLFVRNYLGLDDAIGVTVVNAVFERTRPDDSADQHKGWTLKSDKFGGDIMTSRDEIFGGATYVRDIYELCSNSNGYKGKYTVPILVDKKTKSIVNNESAEIIRMMSKEFTEIAKNPIDLYPDDLVSKIDDVNSWIYPNINDGVYKAGFATTQEAYDIAITKLFEHLDIAEDILSRSRYLCDNEKITEADIRFFVTLVRFDEVYNTHFKCNHKRIDDYPNLSNYTRDLYQLSPKIAETVNIWHIKNHYYRSHPTINKYGIVPIGPKVDFSLPHDREKKFSKKLISKKDSNL